MGILKKIDRVLTAPHCRWDHRESAEQFHKSHTCPISPIHYSEQKCAHSALNGALEDMGQVHCEICEIGLLFVTGVGKLYTVS